MDFFKVGTGSCNLNVESSLLIKALVMQFSISNIRHLKQKIDNMHTDCVGLQHAITHSRSCSKN